MFDELLASNLSAPICITWEVTGVCNLRCRHCLSSAGERVNGELSLKEAKELIDELAEMQVFYVNVGGGEPFCRPDLFDIIAHAVRRDLPLQISTNGTLIDPELVGRLSDLPYLYLQVSLDGATRRVNDAIRGAGSYDLALRGMRLLAHEGLEFIINCVVTRENFDELPALYILAGTLGATLRVSRLRPTGRGEGAWTSLHPSRSQYVRLHAWLREHPDVLTGDSFFFLSAVGEPVKGLGMCGAGRLTCGITPEGDVFPCSFLIGEHFFAGNVRETPFARIWRESEVFQELRRLSAVGCHECDDPTQCRGGCLAAKYSYHGSLNARDPECVLPLRTEESADCYESEYSLGTA
mgnify:CR=1 FL=1